MNAPIYYVGGSKGGVGKSKVAFALIDYLNARRQSVLLLETDNANHLVTGQNSNAGAYAVRKCLAGFYQVRGLKRRVRTKIQQKAVRHES